MGRTRAPNQLTEAPVDTSTEPVPISEDTGSNSALFIILILILLGTAAFLFWWFFMKKKDDCEDEWNAWQAAQKACDDAKKTAKQKRKEADEQTSDRKAAEKKLKEHCRAFPPACGKPASITDADSGRTVTRDDLFVQRAWSAAAWSGYRAGNQTAQETSDQWNTPPTEKFREEQLERLRKAKADTPILEKAITDAKDAEKKANDDADAAETAANKACDKAAAAKKAYDDCIGAAAGKGAAAVGDAAADAAGAAAAGTAGAAAAGAAAGAGGGKNCDAERQAYNTAKKACDEAEAAADKAEAASDAADKAHEDAEDALDRLCEEYPPLCRDDWIEESGRPDTRVTTKDLHLHDVWAEQVWLDYQNGDITAQEASDRWSQDPPADFVRDELKKLSDAKPLKAARDQAVKDTRAETDQKRAAAEKARTDTDEACAKAAAAKKAWEACQNK